MLTTRLAARYGKRQNITFHGYRFRKVLCGDVECGDGLGLLGVQVGGRWFVLLESGYRERKPGLWTLGNHARKSWRLAPRRPWAGRKEEGRTDERLPSDGDGHVASAMHKVFVDENKTLIIACSALGHWSEVRVKDLREQFTVSPHQDTDN
jgi:hypothetical protein